MIFFKWLIIDNCYKEQGTGVVLPSQGYQEVEILKLFIIKY